MQIEVSWQVIIGLFALEMVALYLLAKKGFKMSDVPDGIVGALKNSEHGLNA